ncbi:MAG: CBS domain-containing protein [Microgenomates group bacterium]
MKTSKLIQTEGIIKASSDEVLSSVLSRLPSSHSAAFIFDKDKKYVGIINPYYSIIKSSHPSNIKIEHCLVHAPHVKLQHTAGKIAQMIMESKIHYLPVFDDQDKFIGMVSARGLFRAYESNNIFTVRISDMIKSKKRSLVTIQEEDTISHALHIFKESKLSKLVVVNKEQKLRGILSYYDLISFLITPKKKERGALNADKSTLQTKRVKHFLRSYVLTLSSGDFARDALHLILEKKIGSIVIIDKYYKPIDIITTRDLLKLLVYEPSAAKMEMSTQNLSLKSSIITKGFFERLKERLMKKRDVAKAKLFVKEEKQGGLFKAVLSLVPKKGNPKVVVEEGRDLEGVLQKVKNDQK